MTTVQPWGRFTCRAIIWKLRLLFENYTRHNGLVTKCSVTPAVEKIKSRASISHYPAFFKRCLYFFPAASPCWIWFTVSGITQTHTAGKTKQNTSLWAAVGGVTVTLTPFRRQTVASGTSMLVPNSLSGFRLTAPQVAFQSKTTSMSGSESFFSHAHTHAKLKVFPAPDLCKTSRVYSF